MTSPPDMARLADELEAAKPGWLPISGHVVNFTFTLTDRDRVVAALRTPIPDTPLDARAVEICAKVAESQAKEFLSPEYATNQPFGSLCERFACEEVAKAIRALLREDREG